MVDTADGKGHREKLVRSRTEILVRKGGLEPPRFYPPDAKFHAHEKSITTTECYQSRRSRARQGFQPRGRHKGPLPWKICEPCCRFAGNQSKVLKLRIGLARRQFGASGRELARLEGYLSFEQTSLQPI